MAASVLTIQTITNAGTIITPVDANVDGNYFINTGKSFLRVVNGSASPITVTVSSPTLCNQGSTHDLSITVAAGVTKDIGPFDYTRFSSSDSYVHVTYSAVTTVTVAAVSL